MPTCPVCEHANAHGWWGQSGTHCRKCHRSWLSKIEVHCVGCCAHFSTYANLDLHKTGTGGCVPPGEVADGKGRLKLRTKAGADGLTWISTTVNRVVVPSAAIAPTAAGSKPLESISGTSG